MTLYSVCFEYMFPMHVHKKGGCLCISMLLINKDKLISYSKTFPCKMTSVKPHLLFHGIIGSSVMSHSLHCNPYTVLLSQAFVLAALIANQLTSTNVPIPKMTTLDKGFIAPFISKQSKQNKKFNNMC